MNKYIAGALAGAAATIPMSALMLFLHRQIPKRERRALPPEQITKKIADELGAGEIVDEETESKVVTLVNHFAYGAASGAAYAAVASKIDLPPVLKGTVYGLAVWTGSYLGWLPLFGVRESATERPASENAMMIAAHVIFGAALGQALETLSDEQIG